MSKSKERERDSESQTRFYHLHVAETEMLSRQLNCMDILNPFYLVDMIRMCGPSTQATLGILD